MYQDVQLFIDGIWRQGRGGGSEQVINPASGAVLANVAHATEADLADALHAAQSGLTIWKTTPPAERAAVLHRALIRLERNSEGRSRTVSA